MKACKLNPRKDQQEEDRKNNGEFDGMRTAAVTSWAATS